MTGLAGCLSWLLTEEDVQNDLFCFQRERLTSQSDTLKYRLQDHPERVHQVTRENGTMTLVRIVRQAVKDRRFHFGFSWSEWESINFFLRQNDLKPMRVKKDEVVNWTALEVKARIEQSNPRLSVII